MNAMKLNPRSQESSLYRHALVFLAAAVWTLLVIQFSARHGRLAHEAAYDDCMYMFDAWWRLLTFDRGGLSGLTETLRIVFPHSPGMALQGMLAFALFGVRDVAPYILNFLPVWLYLYLATGFAKHTGKIRPLLVILLALSFQIAYFMVHEFRPDPSYAVMASAAVLLAFGNLTSPRAGRWLPALLMAGTLYMKPTFFLNSLFIFGLIWILQWGLGWWKIRDSRKAVLQALYPLIPALVLFIVLTAPLFILNFNYFWEYLVRNAFGDEQNIWKIEGGPWGAVQFFTLGWGGRQMLGNTFYSATLLILGGGVASVILREKEHLRKTGIFFFFAVAALFVMAVGQLNTPFFGLTFHFLIVLSAIHVVAPFLNASSRLIRQVTTVAVVLVIFYNFAHFRSYSASPVNSDQVPVMSVVDKRFSVVQQMLDVLEPKVLPRDYIEESNVFVAFVGSVSSGTLRWAAAKRGIPAKFEAFDRNQDLPAYQKAILESDYVITAAEGTPELSLYLPTVARHADVHEWVATHKDFVEIEYFPTYGEGGFHLFKRGIEQPD